MRETAKRCHMRVSPKIQKAANLAGEWSAQLAPASPPRTAHRLAMGPLRASTLGFSDCRGWAASCLLWHGSAVAACKRRALI